MSRDIDVDINELKKFIDVLNRFQDQTTDKLKNVQNAWNRCDETWKGDAKEEFAKGFEATEQSVRRAVEAGEDASLWLQKFYDILDDMRHQR